MQQRSRERADGSGRQDTVLDSVADDRGRGLEMEFPMRRSRMCLNRLRAQTQDQGDVLVRVILGYQLQNRFFARRKDLMVFGGQEACWPAASAARSRSSALESIKIRCINSRRGSHSTMWRGPVRSLERSTV